MTRVLFVGHSAALSGAELFLAGMLARARMVEPHVLLLEDGPLVARMASLGIPVEVCPAPGGMQAVSQRGSGGAGPLGHLTAVGPTTGFVRRLRRAVRASGAEVVHTNSAKAHVVAGAVARTCGLPAAMHVHERLALDTYGRANRGLLHAAASSARTVLANSETTRSSLRPRERGRAHVVPCPVDVPPLAPRTPSRPGRLSIALVGRITAWKGQQEALQALARAHESRGDRPLDLELHVYGQALFADDQEYADQARALAAGLGVADRVHWHGHVDDVPAAMRGHDLVLHASTRPEPFGQVVLEAMAAGVPVLAADQGGPAEVLRHGDSGWLYRQGDVTAMADAIALLATDPALRGRLATGGHARAADFSYDRVLPRWEEVLAATALGGRATRVRRA